MIRLLTSATTDLDADAHARWLTRHAGARLEGIVTDEWPLIGRAGLRLMRGRRERGDVLVTIGDAALAAGCLGWRGGRMFHVPVSEPTPRERYLLDRRRDIHVVTSTRAAAEAFAPGRRNQASWIVPPVEPPTITRDAARQVLGLPPDAITVAVPGTIRNGSGHRLAIWAGAILTFRDPTWRVRLSPRGDVDGARAYVDAYVEHTARETIRVVEEHNDAAILPAADVALFCDGGVPERSAIDAAIANGCAIVAPRALWRRERLPAIDERGLFDSYTARLVARAILATADALPQSRAMTAEPSDAAAAWRRVLEE